MSQTKQILFGRESAKLPGLRGNVGYVGAWVSGCVGQSVKFLRGLHGLHGSKYVLHGSTCYVGPNFYVGCVGHIHFCVGQFFYVGQDFLRELRFLARF